MAASPLDELLYRTVARNLPGGGVWLFDADLRCLVAEGPLAEEWCRRIGTIEGREAVELFDRETLAVILPRLERALRGEADSYETDFRARSFWSHYAPLAGEAGGARVMLLAFDVSERKRIEQARDQTEARLKLAVSLAHLGFWEWDVVRNEIFFSPQWKHQIGYDEDELPNRIGEWETRLHPDDRQRVLGKLALYLGHPEGDYRVEFRLRHRDGSYRWIVAQALAETGIDGQVLRLVGTHLDVTELKLAEQGVRVAALHDALTGLPNRALVFEYADLLFAAARRSHSSSAVLFIDLDRFKPVNDLYGHEVGDRVLREVAMRLRACVRHEDLVGRLGGDEFVVVLPHIGGGARRAATVAGHIIDGIGRPFEIGELSLYLSPSIGISHFPEHGEDADALIRAADLAMYQAKHAGRANYQFYTPQFEQHADESARIEAALRRALDGEGLALHYQPVIDMNSGDVVSVEALLRLQGAEGPIPPERFIPVAESAGLIGQVGEWVAIEACRQHESWRAAGLPPVTIAINVSPLQFRQRSFAERLRAIIDSAGVSPGSLQVEVTESAVMDSVDEAVRILDEIKGYGIKVALDDFGTGYSSLSRLGVLPLDKLKVDQSFVKGVESERTSRAIIDAIIALGRTLNLEVVGEGIESDDAMSYLRERHCDQAQGYLISRPLSAADFAAWMRRREATEPA